MSATPSNPFVLPGFGQSGDAATNPLMASLEMMRQAFAGLAGPAGMTSGLSLSPPMNPEELERKIAELKSVENWLKLNLSMLSSTIQGMEVQLATIATLKSFMAANSAAAPDKTANAQSAPSSWMSGWPSAPTPAQSEPVARPTQPEPSAPPASDAGAAAPPAAAKAWWDMLQHQFSQVAAATAASMASKPASTASKAPAQRARAAKKTSSKVNTKKAS